MLYFQDIGRTRHCHSLQEHRQICVSEVFLCHRAKSTVRSIFVSLSKINSQSPNHLARTAKVLPFDIRARGQNICHNFLEFAGACDFSGERVGCNLFKINVALRRSLAHLFVDDLATETRVEYQVFVSQCAALHKLWPIC